VREFERKGNETREIRTVEIRLINVYYSGSPSGNRNKIQETTIPETPVFYFESTSPRWRYYYMPYSSY
jgi:hypothetical protein